MYIGHRNAQTVGNKYVAFFPPSPYPEMLEQLASTMTKCETARKKQRVTAENRRCPSCGTQAAVCILILNHWLVSSNVTGYV